MILMFNNAWAAATQRSPRRSAANSTRRRTGVTTVSAGIVLLAVIAGCGAPFPDDDKQHIIAAAYPFAWLAEQIGGNYVDVHNLTQSGTEPHDVELTPHQVAAVQDADIVLYERDFQPSVDNAVDQAGRAGSATVDVSDVVKLRKGRNHHHADPHVWLDPNNMIAIADDFAGRLSESDPQHKSVYGRRAKELRAKLTDLDSEYRTGLATCRRSLLVTSHAAFGYLTGQYGLKQIPIAGIDPSHEPSPDKLESIAGTVRRHSVPTIFTEPNTSNDVARTIARETDAKVAPLDPIESAEAGASYLRLMRINLSAIQKANGCS